MMPPVGLRLAEVGARARETAKGSGMQTVDVSTATCREAAVQRHTHTVTPRAPALGIGTRATPPGQVSGRDRRSPATPMGPGSYTSLPQTPL